ncbi:MAG: response regulator [Acidimicrobiales bacterium]|nr:response regulator [Acidimicrobiales bacterium]
MTFRNGGLAPVLLVDDNVVNQLVVRETARKLGYEAHTVASGREALLALARSPYCAVLMDCQMPGMDGYETTRLLRESGINSRTPVIALTGGASPSDRVRCLAAGMNDYVTKPVSRQALEMVLSRWCLEVDAADDTLTTR